MAASEERAGTGEEEDPAVPAAADALITFTATRPEYLSRVWDRRERHSGPPLSLLETATIQTTEQAWERLVGELTPAEWLDLGGPQALDLVVRYLDPSELHTIRGPFCVRGRRERRRLGTLLWRHLVLHKEAARASRTGRGRLRRR